MGMARYWLGGLCGLALAGGCSPTLISNLTEERSGNVTIQFINNTRDRAAFSVGAFDSFDRNPPGAVTLNQQLVEGNSTLAPITVPCARNVAIGTREMLQRVLDTDADNVDTFNPDVFVEGVNFSSAPPGSEAEALPTAGTAAPIEVLLGVDYSCEDLLIFEFIEDATAAGGFRVQFSVIRDAEDDGFGL